MFIKHAYFQMPFLVILFPNSFLSFHTHLWTPESWYFSWSGRLLRLFCFLSLLPVSLLENNFYLINMIFSSLQIFNNFCCPGDWVLRFVCLMLLAFLGLKSPLPSLTYFSKWSWAQEQQLLCVHGFTPPCICLYVVCVCMCANTNSCIMHFPPLSFKTMLFTHRRRKKKRMSKL